MEFISLPTMALSWWFIAISVHLGGVVTSYNKYSRDNKEHSSSIFPSVSTVKRNHKLDKQQQQQQKEGNNSITELSRVTILRPLKGLDCNIEANLLSSFEQDYPVTHYEIIFCVADENDPVIPLVHSIFVRYPKHDARLIIGDITIGVNPKINNLISGYESAKHDIIWIIDSNIWVSSGTLRRSVNALQKPGIGLVHHLPVGVQSASFGSQLEMLFLNSIHARAYLAINQLGPSSCVIGKSTLFRRSDLAICGGLSSFGKYIAEDNMIGQAIWDLGLRHEITQDRAWQSLGTMNTWDYFSRRQRWGRIRKYTVRFASMIEPLSECIILGAIFAYSVGYWLQQWPGLERYQPSYISLYIAHMLVWMMIDYIVGTNVAQHNSLSLYQFICTWLVREVTCLPTYVWAMSGSTISWRNYQYRLQSGGTVQQINNTCSYDPIELHHRHRHNDHMNLSSLALQNAKPLPTHYTERERFPSTQPILSQSRSRSRSSSSSNNNNNTPWFDQFVHARELYHQWIKPYMSQMVPTSDISLSPRTTSSSRKSSRSNLILLSTASPMTSKVVKTPVVLGSIASKGNT